MQRGRYQGSIARSIFAGFLWFYWSNHGWWNHRRYLVCKRVCENYLSTHSLVVTCTQTRFTDVHLRSECHGLGWNSTCICRLDRNESRHGMEVDSMDSVFVSGRPTTFWKRTKFIDSIGCVYMILLPFTMEETRSSILLMRLARTLRKETGNKRYRARIEDERLSLSKLIWISCTRPVRAYFLFFMNRVVYTF